MRDSVLLFLAATASIVLQLAIAPCIEILGAMPNFVLVFVGVAAMFRPSDSMMVVGFGVGMAYDLVSSGTPGVMAALLSLVAFCASRASMRLGNDTLSVSLLITMAASLLVEVCYALFFVTMTEVSLLDALLVRALPCALYDCAVCLIVLPLLAAAFARGASVRIPPESSTIRLR
ncbi:MAG: rod shape-determining protein MreD [Slackia sp.]|nr:rod shape-determining protein MreD [Slackia sp.]